MDLKPQNLKDRGFRLQDVLDHEELIPFIRVYLSKKTRSARIYTLSNALGLGFWLALFVFNYPDPYFKVFKALSYSFYGFVAAFLLVPVHEYLHVLAYKWVGAKNTSFDANLKKFYFMALADDFVANRREFRVVGLTPFVVITACCILGFFLVQGLWLFSLSAMCLTHMTFCSGDFGLMSYFDFHAPKEVVTYDDSREGKSYFYVKENGDNNS